MRVSGAWTLGVARRITSPYLDFVLTNPLKSAKGDDVKRPDRLTASFCKTVRRAGFFSDGGKGAYGLKLRVAIGKAGIVSKTWTQSVRVAGKQTTRGLGLYPDVGLDMARFLAVANVIELKTGIDPRQGAVVDHRANSGDSPTFREVAAEYIATVSGGWKPGGGARRKWEGTIEAVDFRDKHVGAITREDVRNEVVPIWAETPSVARGRLVHIRRILDFADMDPNVADGLRAKLPRRNGGTRHYPALAYTEIPKAIRRIRAYGARPRARVETALVMEYCLLTASRPNEAAGVRWEHIDRNTWTIPAALYKTGRAHRVALSSAALAVLADAHRRTGGKGLCFPAANGGEIPRSTLGKVIRRQKIGGSLHGNSRSSFRDWAAENAVDRQVAEACLGHVVNGTEGAYYRTDVLDRRRSVMEAWGLAATRED